MTTTRRTITIYWDDQDAQSVGWAYRVSGGDSGPIDGDAAAAVQSIIDGYETPYLDALRTSIGWRRGDMVEIAGPGLPGSLGDLLDR
jgi:hypothetical protein